MGNQKNDKRNPRQWMRITFPEALDLKYKESKEFGGIEFLDWVATTQPQFTADLEGLRAGMRVDEACRDLANDEPVDLEWRDLERAQKAIDKPVGGYVLSPPAKNLPFCEALFEAEEYEQPKPEREAKDKPAAADESAAAEN